jgi:hypothetical protein
MIGPFALDLWQGSTKWQEYVTGAKPCYKAGSKGKEEEGARGPQSLSKHNLSDQRLPMRSHPFKFHHLQY